MPTIEIFNLAYQVIIPDIPGCFFYGDTQEDAIGNMQEAVELYYEGEDVSELPVPSQMTDLLNFDSYLRGNLSF